MRLNLLAACVRHGISSGAYADQPLPDGVSEIAIGRYRARCRSCERDYELVCAPEEFDPEYSYCNRSDRCIP